MENENTLDEVRADVVDSPEAVEADSVNEEVAPSQEETEQPTQTEKVEQSPEENAKFAEVRRKAEAEAKAKAKDEMIAEMYGESHGIYTYADYQEAIAEQREQEEMAKLAEEKEIPEEVAKELLEAKKLKEQISKQEMTLKQQQEQQKQFQEFVEAFPGVQPSEIPKEVWDKFNTGVPLKYAYIEAQYNKIQEGIKAKELNQQNAEASTGSLKGKLDTASDFIGADEFENNRHDMDWVKKNYNKIIESRPKW